MTKLVQRTEETNPFAFMRRVTEELDRAFGFKPDIVRQPELLSRMWMPAIEAFERDNTFFVYVDLPGLKKEDVKIEITHAELTIEGERRFEKKEEQDYFYRAERVYGKFYRQLEIPEHVKAEGAVATFKDGVLEIKMPAIPVPEVTKRTVEIKG